MGDIDTKKLAEWKEALAKSGITYETDAEYEEALKNLAGFFDVLIQIDLEQQRTIKTHDTISTEHSLS